MSKTFDELEKKSSDLDVSIIVPLFNEEESLPELHQRLTTVMKSSNYSYEVIFLNDGSTDGSKSILESFVEKDKRTVLVSLRRNFGKTNALMIGFNLARGEKAVTIDADLQDRPENIPTLLKETDCDLVSGWRKNRSDSRVKKILAFTFKSLIRVLFGMSFNDLNSGLKAYSRDLYKSLNLYGDLHRLTMVIARTEGFSVSEVAITHDFR